MVKQKKAQAAFEYLTTYGWAILTALISVGALAYFGFLNPTNLMPNKCDFGTQLECVEYRIFSTGDVNLMLRNNFGKQILIEDVEGIEMFLPPADKNTPLTIGSGATEELSFKLEGKNIKPGGEKKEISLIITFRRDQAGSPSHNISGTVFVTVQ